MCGVVKSLRVERGLMHCVCQARIPALEQRPEPTPLLMSASETLSSRGQVADLGRERPLRYHLETGFSGAVVFPPTRRGRRGPSPPHPAPQILLASTNETKARLMPNTSAMSCIGVPQAERIARIRSACRCVNLAK